MAELYLKQKLIHTNGNLPAVGTKAPDFTLTAQDLSDKHLSDFSGKKKLIYTLPSIDTPTCEKSTKNLNESAKIFQDVVFLIISCDLPFAQKRFCHQEGANNVVTLSLMRDKKFAESYGILITEGVLKGLCARSIFILDSQDKILYQELVSDVAHEPNYDAAIKALKA